MIILVCGARGFIGSTFLRVFPEWIGSTVDIANPHLVAEELDKHRPDVVLNCAGKTGRPNIDWCETHKLTTARSNIAGPLVLLEQCLRRGAKLVHIGSGCIFEGDNGGEGFAEEDSSNYRGSYYSRTKLAADEFLSDHPVLILRLRMPFDGSNHTRNLLNRLANYCRVLDAQNSITHLAEFVDVAGQLIARGATGIYHIVNPGTISPFEIMLGYREKVDPTHVFHRLTIDQLNHVTDTGRSNCLLSTCKLEAAGISLRPVHEAVDTALRELSTNSMGGVRANC